MPWTSLLRTLGWLSNSSGTATALATSSLSTLAHASVRAAGSTVSAAALIAALIWGSLTCPWLELPVDVIDGP